MIRRAADILAAWIALIAIENLVVGIGFRALFVASWEMAAARRFASPIAVAMLVPCALLVSHGVEIAVKNRRIIVGVAAATGALVAYGVSNGRHFDSLAARASFVIVVAIVSALSARAIIPRLFTMSNRARVVTGIFACAIAWCADAFVLPRLYPAFHVALSVLALLAAALVTSAWRAKKGDEPSRAERWIPRISAAIAIGTIAWTPFAARAIAPYDNLRLVLVDHAPILGPAVRLATMIARPEPLDEDAGNAAVTLNEGTLAEIPRALDWSGRDIVLLTVDALRADHLSSYGYARKTTPNIDALAAKGARFTHAYCPTPHTSYSITSMMTGKYIRPLLALGLGEDSETWAAYLRRYGYRTAAFYPPAVFFIDADKFEGMQSRALDFEYKKIEFATPEVREAQIDAYLTHLPREKKLFLWLHLFEPHEPYVFHEDHPFGDAHAPKDVDAYDSEVATADDAIGHVIARVESQRPGAVIIVTADHGEELGDHGGRYHGTTVYEEQVRVPLVVAGPGVPIETVDAPVQTIDLLPTVLSALGIPRPPRLRGRDLGPALHGAPLTNARAFAETDDFTLVAAGDDRLVCRRSIDACALYDVAKDPAERKDTQAGREARVRELKAIGADIERAHGRYERGARAELPEALRRGLQGDADAAEDSAALLDDADVRIRRAAAEVCYRVHTASILPAIRRAFSRDEDLEVKKWTALALVRERDPKPALVDAILTDADPAWRSRAALVLAEQGDARGTNELVARWQQGKLELAEAREILSALAHVRAKTSVPALVRSLDDVRLRPYVADALGAIGSPDAKAPLLVAFEKERYASTRPHEARALVSLGAVDALVAPLTRFCGVPDAAPELAEIARSAGLVVPAHGGVDAMAHGLVDVPKGVPLRAYVFLARNRDAGADTNVGANVSVNVHVNEKNDPLALEGEGAIRIADVAPSSAQSIPIDLEGADAVWLVPRSADLPPPAPESWDAGASSEDSDAGEDP